MASQLMAFRIVKLLSVAHKPYINGILKVTILCSGELHIARLVFGVHSIREFNKVGVTFM